MILNLARWTRANGQIQEAGVAVDCFIDRFDGGSACAPVVAGMMTRVRHGDASGAAGIRIMQNICSDPQAADGTPAKAACRSVQLVGRSR
jgi:hypothetical protein